MSTATIVTPVDPSSGPDGRNGRANASASSSERRDAQRQQQQLAQMAFLGQLDRRALEQLDRGELHARLRLALQQVQHDRNGGGRGPDEEERRQERHSARARVERYESSAISSGCDVGSTV